MKNRVGLYFGSFNPVHIGHMAIANYLVEYTPLQQIWFVVSPQNPLKQKKTLLNEHHRLSLVRDASGEDSRFVACDFEFYLPQPSYTINTLAYLAERYPQKSFALIMGEDNLRSITKWKNHEAILTQYDIYIYPRIAAPTHLLSADSEDALAPEYLTRVKSVKAPIIEVSSTQIRNAIAEGKDIRHFLPANVYNSIQKGGYYKKAIPNQ